MLGILLVNKPVGITSHDAVYKIRRAFGTKRVGHAGTLDPIAQGLLVAAVGPATRFLQYLPLEPKEYIGVFKFGEETETYDTEGEVIESRPVPGDLDAQIAEQLPQFRGEITQVPPMYSAVKKDGKPLYEYARQGVEVERKSRQVYIENFDPEGGEGDERQFRIVCSGGTYVRTLAHDLGAAVGCGAHVVELVRTQVGRFHLDNSVDIDGLANAKLIPLREALAPMEMVQMNETQVAYIRDGRTIQVRHALSGKFAGLLDTAGDLISVARVDSVFLHPECVIPEAAC